MSSAPHISYLHRHQIDTAKWDRCVIDAPNGWLYARSFYLDGIGSWDALVMGDYEYIMPLPNKKKYGLRYIYIPPFTGQLGIIGVAPVTRELTAHFIAAIPGSFSLADLLMNEQNPGCPLPGIRCSRRTNYIIPLDEEYIAVYDRYTKDAKKNLRRTTGSGLSACSDIPMETVIKMYTDAYGRKNKTISPTAYQRFAKLGEECIDRGNGFTIGIRRPDGQLLATAFFGKDNKRIYYILGAPSQTGRAENAIHSLVDQVIRKFAGTGITFDFEGSDIPSVSYFYKKFSPVTRQYDLLQLDRLPGWLQWLRKIAAHAK